MATVTLRKIGNSDGVVIPKTILEELGLKRGQDLELLVHDHDLLMRPVKKEPSLNVLVKKITTKNRHSEFSYGAPVGSEKL